MLEKALVTSGPLRVPFVRLLTRQGAPSSTRIQGALWQSYVTSNTRNAEQRTEADDAEIKQPDAAVDTDREDPPGAKDAPRTSGEASSDGQETGGDGEMISAAEYTKLAQELGTWKDRCLRTMADMENSRRIAARDVANAKEFGVAGLAKSMLDVADNLNRALSLVPKAEDGAELPVSMKGFVVGIQATEGELMKVLGKEGVTKFGEVGDAFDPNRHQALFRVPSAKPEDDGVVLSVTKSGYMIKDRVLRPAEVGVGTASK